MRFIHAANLKLGTGSDPSREWTRNRAEELWEDVEKLADAVKNLSADALFLTGNVFDHVPSRAELDRLDSLFLRLSARVFIAPGELDADERTERVRRFPWRSHTKVFAGDAVDRVYIPGWETEITGVGYTKKNYGIVSWGRIQPGVRGAMQVLLLPFIGSTYTSLLLPEDPGKLPYDYIGTGQSGAVKGLNGYPVYGPGCFEPEGFSGQKNHGFLLCELKRDDEGKTSLKVRMIRNAKREYRTLKLLLTWEQTFPEVRDKVSEAIQELGAENVYRIVFSGPVPPALFYRKEELLKLGNVTEIIDRTTEEELFQHVREYGPTDLTGRLLLNYQEENGGMTEKAFRYALDALLKTSRESGK